MFILTLLLYLLLNFTWTAESNDTEKESEETIRDVEGEEEPMSTNLETSELGETTPSQPSSISQRQEEILGRIDGFVLQFVNRILDRSTHSHKYIGILSHTRTPLRRACNTCEVTLIYTSSQFWNTLLSFIFPPYYDFSSFKCSVCWDL